MCSTTAIFRCSTPNTRDGDPSTDESSDHIQQLCAERFEAEIAANQGITLLSSRAPRQSTQKTS
jgi:hypothetical protein